MKLKDCEVIQRFVRNINVAFIYGPRPITAVEAKALRAEYALAHGPIIIPCYVSPAGWQLLDLNAIGDLPTEDPPEAGAAEVEDEPKGPAPKRGKSKAG